LNRKSLQTMIAGLLILLIVSGCSPSPEKIAQPITTSPTPIAETSLLTQQPVPLPLSAPGPYHTGTREYNYEDASREGRKVGVTIWYPALQDAGSTSSTSVRDAKPDLGTAPYPLILSSTKVANFFAPHLASYGFVVAGISRQDSADQWDAWLIDYPLDIVFALNQIASHSPTGLEGVMDASHAGAMGYSFDGYNALALSGARVDPQFYLSQCAKAAAMQPAPPTWWVKYICAVADKWDAFAAHAGSAITASQDGLWQPMTDARILAVMPMAPEGAWLFGPRGLAAVDRPTLIIDGTEDDINIYNLEAAYIYEHLGTPERSMVSFIGKDHMMIYSTDQVARMSHFAVAFFGYYLQNRKDSAAYFSKDFVAKYPDLAWGVVSNK